MDWKQIVAGVAPALGTALGGPLAGQAVSILAQALGLGSGASEDDVSTAVHGLSGDQRVALAQADQTFKLEMARIAAQTEEGYLKDVQDARAREVAIRDFMPQIIFFLMLAAEVAFIVMFMRGNLPTDEFTRALITTGFGAVNTGFVGSIAYFIGSSRGSKASGDAVRKIAERVTT